MLKAGRREEPKAGEVLSPSVPLGSAHGDGESSRPCLRFVFPWMGREGSGAGLIEGEKRGFWHRTEPWEGPSAASKRIQCPEEERERGQALTLVAAQSTSPFC